VKTLAACAALVLAFVVVLPAATAGTAPETCHGRPATVVGTAGDDLVATEGADVIVSHGALSVSALGGDDLVCVTGSTYYVYGGEGDDTVDATAQASGGLTVLGLGADTFSGGPGFDRVHTGQTHRDNPDGDDDDDRDVVLTGAGGSLVTSGATGSVNDDTIVLGETRRRRNTLLFEGVQGLLGTVSFGTGKAALTVLGAEAAGDVTTVDNGRRTVLTDATPVLEWDGAVDQFYVSPSMSQTLVFHGTEADEHLNAYPWLALRADMGPGDDRVSVGCESLGIPPTGSLDFGSGRDRAVLVPFSGECHDLDIDLVASRLLPDLESTGLEDVDVGYASGPVDFRGDDHANVLRVAGCSVVANGRGGDDRLAVTVPSDCDTGGTVLRGGSGDDSLVGTPFADRLLGGAGRDSAAGRGARDTCRVEIATNCERSRVVVGGVTVRRDLRAYRTALGPRREPRGGR
jgi:hypothetical protein